MVHNLSSMTLSFLNCKSDHALCSGESCYVVHSHDCDCGDKCITECLCYYNPPCGDG